MKLSRSFPRSRRIGQATAIIIAAVIGLHFTTSASVVFAEDKSTEVDYPLAVINAASLQRLRDNAGVMFESAERQDMTDRVDQWMVDTLKETKGIDRSRPFGVMIYLRSDAVLPVGVMYLPVTNLDDALGTLAYGIGTIVPVEGKPERQDIEYVEESRKLKIRTLYRHGYLFVVGPDGNDSTLNREFPDPEKMTSRISSQYDIAISLMIKTIPLGMKTVFLAYFKNQLTASLQQRDDELESAYRWRRAQGEIWLELIDKVVSQGNDITLGARLDGEQKTARIELEIASSRDSKLAKFFQSMAGKKSYFGNLITNPSTLTMSLSLVLEEKQRQQFVKYFEAAQRDFLAGVDQDDREELQEIVDPIFKNLITLADAGHLDAFAQLTGTEQGEFALIGGMKLATYRELPTKAEDLIEFLKDSPDYGDLVTKLELAIESIDSHPVHRLTVDSPNDVGKRMFGESPSLYMHVTPEAIWGSFGSDAALPALRDAIQHVALPQDPGQGRNRVPLLIVTRAKNWLSIGEDANGDSSDFTKRAEASFGQENDSLIVEIRPTDSGLRIRADFQSGFISLMGRGITTGIESGAFRRPPPRRRQDGQPGGQKQPEPASEQVQPQN